MKLAFDKGIYDKQALLKTAYSFSDRVYLHLSQDQERWTVEWEPKHTDDEVTSSAFENELIDQQLRLDLVKRNQDLRKLLLARALASTVIELPPKETASENIVSEQSEILKGWYANHAQD